VLVERPYKIFNEVGLFGRSILALLRKDIMKIYTTVNTIFLCLSKVFGQPRPRPTFLDMIDSTLAHGELISQCMLRHRGVSENEDNVLLG
jgi:hypothetical protein